MFERKVEFLSLKCVGNALYIFTPLKDSPLSALSVPNYGRSKLRQLNQVDFWWSNFSKKYFITWLYEIHWHHLMIERITQSSNKLTLTLTFHELKCTYANLSTNTIILGKGIYMLKCITFENLVDIRLYLLQLLAYLIPWYNAKINILHCIIYIILY